MNVARKSLAAAAALTSCIAARCHILFILLFCSLPRALAQRTIQSGFENYAVDTRPPFVSLDFRTISHAAVADSSTIPSIPAFEGQRFLGAGGSIFLESPNGQAIEAYTLHLFIRDAPNLRFGIEGQRSAPLQFDTWQTIQGSFDSPVQSFNISGFYSVGETFDQFYAIDAVQFTTVPEPQTFWLITLGLTAVIFLPHWKRMKSPAALK